ncbi:hypothetical protein J6590_090647 [Homalodisca vitripennis]|nr:hypothetical protein J6590_090647 [Homalodisca vitripennis]
MTSALCGTFDLASFGGNFTGRTQCLWVPGEISLTIVNQYVWYEHLLEGTSQGELGVYEYPDILWRELHKANSVSMGTRRDFPHYRQSVRLVRASSGGNFTRRTRCL